MPATIALLAGILFAVVAIVRLFRAQTALRHVQLAAALAAALFGIATWHATTDSRWLVGAIVFLGAGLPGWLAGRRRGLAVAATVAGLLALALFAIARAHPMIVPAAA